MKLTALAGSTTHVDLFAISDRQASAEGFHLAVAGKYLRNEGMPGGPDIDDPQIAPCYDALGIGLSVGHPAVCSLMWDGCVVSHLKADLPAARTDRDVTIAMHDRNSHRDVVYSPQALDKETAGIVGWGCVALAVAAGFAFFNGRRPGLLGLALIGLVVAGMTSWVWVFRKNTMIQDVVVNASLHPIRLRSEQRGLASHARDLAERGLWCRSGDTAAELAKLPDLLPKKNQHDRLWLNPFTEKPIRYERSRGTSLLSASMDRSIYACTTAMVERPDIG